MQGAGGPCVMMAGTCGTPPWPAGSWAAARRWPPLERPGLGLALGRCGWMTSGAEAASRPCGTVHGGPGDAATVTTARMQGWCAAVCVGSRASLPTHGAEGTPVGEGHGPHAAVLSAPQDPGVTSGQPVGSPGGWKTSYCPSPQTGDSAWWFCAPLWGNRQMPHTGGHQLSREQA